MNRFLDGNIVDSAYLWPILDAPTNQRKDASTAFSVNQCDLDLENNKNADKLFVVECSYGATIYALVNKVMIIELE